MHLILQIDFECMCFIDSIICLFLYHKTIGVKTLNLTLPWINMTLTDLLSYYYCIYHLCIFRMERKYGGIFCLDIEDNIFWKYYSRTINLFVWLARGYL